MGFVAGILLGIVLTIGLTFVLLFIAKALGFSLFLHNEWRDDHGYYRRTNYTAYRNSYGCHDCWYKEKYYNDHLNKTDDNDIDRDEELEDGGSNEKESCE